MARTTLPTKMRVLAPTEPLLEDDEVALYWDPRYKRYFYAGIMTPPTGQLYDFTGTAVALPSDTHTWSVVQLEQPDPFAVVPPPGPSILLRPDQTGRRRRRNKERRIKWNFLSVSDGAEQSELADTNRGWDVASALRCMVCPLLLLIVAAIGALVWFGVLLPRSRDSIPSPYTDDGGYTTDPGIVVRPFYPELVHVSLTPPRKRAGREETKELGGAHLIDFTAKDSLVSTTDYVLTTTSVPYFDAAVAAVSAAWSRRDFETRRDVCLVAGSKSPLENPEVNGSLGEAHCDALVRCCYYLPLNLSIEDGLIARGNYSSTDDGPSMAASRTVMLLGVHVGDDVAFQSLLGNWRGERAKFLLGIVQAAQTGKFSGVRLWVPLQEERGTRGANDHLVLLARDVASELRGRNYTFGFFLPQGLLSEQLAVTTAELVEALNGAPYSLLLYPEVSTFWNVTTGSTTATWPTPEEVLAHAQVETAQMDDNSSICYLPPPPAAVQARLAEHCDPNKTQLVSRAAYLTFPTLLDVRRRLRGDDAWISSARRYYTYACKDSWALLYQTPRQTRQFRDDLFVAAPSSTCLGFFLEGLPGASDEIDSESG